MVSVGSAKIGGGNFGVVAGPCSVENEDQMVEVAPARQGGRRIHARGGAFKPRTSPYSFQGMGTRGLDLLLLAKEASGLPIVTELMSPKYIDLFEEKVDVVQIVARNMHNFDLLKEVGKMSKPILLKRGLSIPMRSGSCPLSISWSEGNENVILCERGIRTFETYTRNTLDVAAIPCIKRMSHLPIIVDPSHSGGMSWLKWNR